MLLLLHRHLWLGVLACLEAAHALATQLCSLEGLQVSNLQRVEALGTEHLLRQKNLSLRELHKLRLGLVLEVTKGADRLVNGATGPMTWLERRSICGLVHVKVTHVLGLVVLSRLLLVVLRLSPVAIEVAGLATAMTLATTALEVRLLTGLVGGVFAGRWE